MTMKDANLDVLPKPGLLINGERITRTSGGQIEHIYPATGKPTVRVPLAGNKEIDQAVQAARAAFPEWRAMPADERRNLMFRFSQLLTEKAESISQMITVENGTPISIARNSPTHIADVFAYNAGWADKIGGHVVDVWPAPALDYTLEEPYGVVAVILPWNAPAVQFSMIAAPALAAGNCIVVKPSSVTPFTAVRLGELLLEAGFPPGVVNVIPTGSGGGEALCSHPGIDKIHLTGSVATARAVMTAAAKNVTPVGFELGGKSANIIFNDANLQDAAQSAVMWLMLISGQVCIKGSRILVQSGVYDQVIEQCRAFTEDISVGDPALETTMMGPVVSASQCTQIMGFIERAKQTKSGRLVTGGQHLGGELAEGYFISPTIFADVDANAEIAREEVFGPVLTITRFDTEEEAINIANNTEFGLAGYIHTNDLKRAHRVAKAMNTGNIWINEFVGMPASIPFGGIKKSGFGRVGGIEGIREFTRPKNVMVST